jgi:CDP-paratose 2-epimerase
VKKVIITGGAGFMGTNLASHYLNRGHEVLVFDNLSRKGSDANLDWLKEHEHAQQLEVLIGDVRRPPPELAKAIESSDAVFHFAAQVAVTTSVADPRLDFDVNALGTFNILELVRTSSGAKPPVFYSSTNKVYGGMEDIAVVEDERAYSYRDLPQGVSEDRGLDFHSPYGCSKGCADQYLRDYARIYGIQTVVFRQSCIYGYRQFGVEDQGWVAWFVIAASLGLPLKIYGDGKQVRDVLFIDDLIAAFDKAWERIDRTSGSVYNIGGGPDNVISLLDLINCLRERHALDLSIQRAAWRPGDQRVYISDIGKADREIGWRPRVSWEDGVSRLVEWVRDNKTLLAGFV